MPEVEIAQENIETIEGNKLIAEFIGYGKKQHEYDINFHSSWDRLMPVVEKIESLVSYIETYFEKGWGAEVKIYDEINLEPVTRVHDRSLPKIEVFWLAVVEFIKWHNKEPK